jgi:hypothetical protein
MTGTRSPVSRELARQLIARETAGADDPGAVATAMQRLCTRISDNLRRAVGDDGYNALLVRVLTPETGEHPVMADIRRSGDTATCLNGVVAHVDDHGVTPVAEALEMLLATLIDVLGGLIGADMALNILDIDSSSHYASNGRKIQ